ncbi:hypothetical protein BY458DRAFT_559797 [Sporodiniella umbellata]|nr:hypothetical protein BY458DRAFT_559797 [Sporodiniella umbellata]
MFYTGVLFCFLLSLIHAYEVTLCDLQGCMVSSEIAKPLSTTYHEAAVHAVHETVHKDDTDEAVLDPPRKDYTIVIASIGGVLGVAGIAAAVFLVQRQKHPSPRKQPVLPVRSFPAPFSPSLLPIPPTPSVRLSLPCDTSPTLRSFLMPAPPMSLKHDEQVPRALNKFIRDDYRAKAIHFHTEQS